MTTDYDQIASEYKQAKQHPWRYFIERYTFLQLIGDVEGMSVLDLACGEGWYTRELRRRGAARVVGVDLSEGMIELARQEEARGPLGIEYRVQDARLADGGERFDLVVAAYLLNYASTREELGEMCMAVARSLKPGGRFVAVNNNPDQAIEHFAASRKYGLIKSTPGELHEGAPIVFTIFQGDSSFDITNYWLSPATHEECLRAAGLRQVRWHRPQLSPEVGPAFGGDFWEAFLTHPPITFLECVR
jgi:2-polyprenyl-3-methyl-5-hydroxy-6-metoxy-1,4-benzoquinol methylase